MNYYFITGSSKGLGKSLAELLLHDDNNTVYGISRNASIQHERYIHITLDLSQPSVVKSYQFPELINIDKIILVNNAGIVGDVKHVGKIDNQKIINCYNLNLIAPAILTNNFISTYSLFDVNKTVVNISSGAGRNPIDGWSVYCSSKAGLDMFSQVLNEEIKINDSTIKVLSLAPGIIDTEMQVQIRRSEQKEFSNIDRFIEYKKNGDLATPEITAELVVRFILEDELSTNVICSVKDLTK